MCNPSGKKNAGSKPRATRRRVPNGHRSVLRLRRGDVRDRDGELEPDLRQGGDDVHGLGAESLTWDPQKMAWHLGMFTNQDHPFWSFQLWGKTLGRLFFRNRSSQKEFELPVAIQTPAKRGFPHKRQTHWTAQVESSFQAFAFVCAVLKEHLQLTTKVILTYEATTATCWNLITVLIHARGSPAWQNGPRTFGASLYIRLMCFRVRCFLF